MDEPGFRQFLQPRQLSDEQLDQQIASVERFEAFLKTAQPPVTLQQADGKVTQAFVDTLIADGANTFDNLVAVARYARFVKNNAAFVAILELLDGSEALEGMYRKVGQVVGEQKRDEIFDAITLPPLGLSNVHKARLMQIVMERIECLVDAGTYRRIFVDSFRDLPEAGYLRDKEKYLACANLDEFLELKRREFVAELEKCRDEGRLFFSQEITDEVVEWVRNDPEVSQGVRRGGILYVTKIPYMTKEYLAETDPDKKRYYYCHCPWARESLRQGEASGTTASGTTASGTTASGTTQPVSAKFCQCSAGFHKKMWEVIFGHPLEAEVLESVLKGDLRCRFAIHLPTDLLG